MVIFTVLLGFLQGFIDWPLIVTSVRWMFKWAEEGPKQRPPEWVYFIFLIIAVLWSQVIQITIAFTLVPDEQRAEGLRTFLQLWGSGRFGGIVAQMLSLAYLHRIKSKKSK